MADDKKKLTKITVRGLRGKTRWRAGEKFGEEPREVEVTEDQLAAIKADPELVIVPQGK